MTLSRSLIPLAAAFALTGAAPALAAKPDPVVRYRLTPELGADGLRDLAVEIRFTADASGRTRLKLPTSWGGEDELWKHLRDLTVEGATVSEDGPAVRVLTSKPGARLTVRYRVVSAWDHDPAVGEGAGNPYRPIVRPRWFSAIGYTLFAAPEAASPRPADFRWGPLSAGWKTASDLDHVIKGRKTTTEDIGQSTSVGARDLKVVTRTTAGAEVKVAVIGTWTMDTDAFADTLSKVVEAEHAYWHDRGEPYTVTVTPLTPRAGSISLGGTGLDDGFAIYGGTDSPLERMRYLLAHEHMHTWNPLKLGVPPPEDREAEDYWFSEGFTDFLTYRVLLRSGVWSLEDYASNLNEMLAAYAGSSARTAPNNRIVTDFWKDYAVQKLAYQRGQLLAMVWDGRLRRASGGRRDLDDVLLTQARLAADNARHGVSVDPTVLFLKAWAQEGGPDLAPDIDRYVQRGEAVLLPTDLYGDCAKLVTEIRPAFDRGFDIEATNKASGVISGVKPDSPAYAAGLRDGMKIVRREGGKPDDSRIDYVYRVDDHGQERVIRYRPEGKTQIALQSLVLTPGMDAAARALCAKRLSGG